MYVCMYVCMYVESIYYFHWSAVAQDLEGIGIGFRSSVSVLVLSVSVSVFARLPDAKLDGGVGCRRDDGIG